MSASIYWESVNTHAPSLKRVGAPSTFIDSMDRAFYTGPWVLGVDHISKLFGMAAMFGGPDEDNPYLELIELIEKTGTVKVWPQW